MYFSMDEMALSPVRRGIITDHEEVEVSPGSILYRTSVTHTPVRNAIFTVSTARGTRSLSDLQQLIATAARVPVQRPASDVWDASGYVLPELE